MEEGMTPKLSILVAGLTTRSSDSLLLFERLQKQCSEHKKDAELICLVDSGGIPTGSKRNILLAAARGDYITFVDDDDMIAPDYIKRILAAHPEASDVISWGVDYSIDGKHAFEARFDIRQPWPNHDSGHGIVTYTGSHTNCWRRELVKDLRFAPLYWGEDMPFTRAACKAAKTQIMLPDVLYFYKYRSGVKEHTINQALATI